MAKNTFNNLFLDYITEAYSMFIVCMLRNHQPT